MKDSKPAQSPTDGRKAIERELSSRHPPFIEALLADARLAAAYRGERHEFRSRLDGVLQALRLMLQTDAFLALAAYRAKVSLKARGVPVLPWIAHRVAMMSAQVSIADTAVVHPAVFIPNGQVVVYGLVEIEPLVTLLPWVTVGTIGGGIVGPKIRAGAHIGTGAKVMGEIEVGARARVGTNAVVLDDVAPNTTVVGMPAGPVTEGPESAATQPRQVPAPQEAPETQPADELVSDEEAVESPTKAAPAETATEVATDPVIPRTDSGPAETTIEEATDPVIPQLGDRAEETAIDVEASTPASGGGEVEAATTDGTAAPPAPPRAEAQRKTWLVAALVGVIAAVALALRWIGAHQSLFGDELFTYFITTSHSLSGLFDRYDLTESTPPVFYVLGWLSGKLGDPTVWIRLPSVLAGAAAVPTLYLLGTKLDRRRAGLIAAALIAVLPFAVFYGSEARAYGLLLFLLPLSTLALLRALEEGRPLWWAVYWLVASLAIYTQYIAGLVVALQAVWALIAWREEWRGILAVNAAVLLTLAPWFGRIDNNTDLLEPIRSLHPLTAGHILTDPLRVAFGNPFVGATEVPGLISLLMVIAAAGIAAVAFIVTRVRRPQAGEQVTAAFQRSRDEIWLLVLLVVGPPVLTLLYSLVGNSIYIARNLISILPYLCVLAAVLIAALPRRAMLAVATLTVLAALLASVRMLVDYARPDLRAAAEMIETHAAPGTQVVEPRFLSTADPLKEDLAIYLDDRYPLSHDLNDLEKVSRGADVWAVVPNPALRGAVDAAAKKAGAKPVDAHTIQGLADVYVADYRRTGGPPAGSQSVPAGVFVGKVHGTSADIALVTDGERLTGAYLCNSKGVSPWFRPALLPDGRADLVTRGGDALGNVSFAGKRATGGVAVGVKSGSFSAQLAKGKAGLYRTTSGKAGKPGFRETGWIMLPDGSKCGSTDVNAPSGYKSVPAPASPKGKVSDFVNPYGL